MMSVNIVLRVSRIRCGVLCESLLREVKRRARQIHIHEEEQLLTPSTSFFDLSSTKDAEETFTVVRGLTWFKPYLYSVLLRRLVRSGGSG
jgi:hypothetical protein